MPDVHYGIGATVGSVIPTKGAIVPAAVGVDIGCGMMAVQTSLSANDLPDNLKKLRTAIEKAVPHGRTNQGKSGDRGAWHRLPDRVQDIWPNLQKGYDRILAKHPGASASNNVNHLGTLGTGNHFIEVCLDENQNVWIMLHSGSRGVGNRIGSYFIELAKEDMRRLQKNLPDKDLAYFSEGTKYFDDYVEAVGWAQEFARENRQIMMDNILYAIRHSGEVPTFAAHLQAINCHHNYVTRERHYGEDVYLTRKGAVRAGKRRARYHSRQHGRKIVHRPRTRKSGELRELQPWRGSCHVQRRSEAAVHGAGPRAHDGRNRMPERCRCHR